MITWILAAVAAAALVAPPAVGARPERPRPLFASARGDTVRATTGSYCVTEGETGTCVDAAYPLAVHGHLLVSPPGLVVLRTHDTEIKRLRLSLLHVAGDDIERLERLDAHRALSHGARWRVDMPRRLGDANRIDVFVRYADGIGDADFWVKIAER
jgi:hypothetical protein